MDKGWIQQVSSRHAELRFAGKGDSARRRERMRQLLPPGVIGAWLRQVHSARVVEVAVDAAGVQGEGDALWTRLNDLALMVVTADCVPVLVEAPGVVGAIHAGWRGIAKEIVRQTLEDLRPHTDAADLRAWIGPAIGSCCYEVGPEVAAAVADASSPRVVREGGAARPRLDLPAAVERQLRESGVRQIERVGPGCTRCAETELWSYRRDGAAAGRNMALIWRRGK